MELKKVQKQDRVRKPQNPTPLRNDAGPLSGLQRNALASLVHCVTHTTKWTRDASALRSRPERRPASFRSGVGFLRLSNPVLFLYFFQLHLYLKWHFVRNFSPLVRAGRAGQWAKQRSKFSQPRQHIWHVSEATQSKVAVEEAVNAANLMHELAGMPIVSAAPIAFVTPNGLRHVLVKPVANKAPVTPEMLASLWESMGTGASLNKRAYSGYMCLLAFAVFF